MSGEGVEQVGGGGGGADKLSGERQRSRALNFISSHLNEYQSARVWLLQRGKKRKKKKIM